MSDALLVTTLDLPTELRINMGGGDYLDTLGNVWVSDYGYNQGRTTFTSDAVLGTLDSALFQTGRWDVSNLPSLQYDFALADGDYIVNMYFTEAWSGAYIVGGRVFDVMIEGMLALDNVDIYSEVGALTALVKSVPVTVTGGEINIEFLHVINNPAVRAIEIVSQ